MAPSGVPENFQLILPKLRSLIGFGLFCMNLDYSATAPSQPESKKVWVLREEMRTWRNSYGQTGIRTHDMWLPCFDLMPANFISLSWCF